MKNTIDIIVPVLNESENISILVKRIDRSLQIYNISYRVIFVDDHSTDNTKELIKSLANLYPVIYKLKKGRIGKAFSILEGISVSKSKYVVMIDGDLQYAPRYIPRMLKKAIKGYDLVIANRVRHNENLVRKIGSKVIKFLAGNVLMGLNVDVQSGLKLFKREIVKHLDVSDIRPWAIDIPLLHTAKELGLKIGSVNINFANRKRGKSKFNFINSIKGIYEVFSGALRLKLKSRKVYYLSPSKKNSMFGAGLIYKGKRFLTHTTLNHTKSAVITFTRWQKIIILSILLILLTGLTFETKNTFIGFIAILSTIYFADVFFNLFLVFKSLRFPPELLFSKSSLENIDDEKLPVYTILCPLYRESSILPQFIESLNKLDYPKKKLEILLLVEEDDKKTLKKAKSLNLDGHFKILIVPDSLPKTKPKACNFGLSKATGEYVVIYDAEDVPEPMQLKKSVLGFQKLGDKYLCLQAKLNYHNPNQNLLTRLFTAEYSLWFDLMLPALQTIKTTIPLGGTSNHFRTHQLMKLEGWDPFNVTEDADLGARLFRTGGKTAIIDSITYEEANSNLKNWIRQRSRWIKGYLQTYLVHMRSPLDFAKKHKIHFLVFQLISGLRISFMIINPILWLTTLSYFVLYKFIGSQIESLYPPIVFYIAITSAVFGNFLYIFYYMIGAAKHEAYQVIKYVYLIPIYWIFNSIAAYVAFWQLLVRPHYWEKTIHGLTKAEVKRILFKFEFEGLRDFGITSINKIKNFSRSSLAGGAFLIGATMLANGLNFLYNAYLGRKLDLEDFGLISLVGSFVYITSIPLSALSRTVTNKSGYLFGKYDTHVKLYWSKVRKQSVKFSVVLAFSWLVLIPVLAHLFKADTLLPFVIFVPVWIIGFAGAVDSGFLSGNLFFIVAGIASIGEALGKLIFSVVFVDSGYHELVYMATPLSMIISFVVGYLYILNIKEKKVIIEDQKQLNFSKKFFFSSIVTKISTVAFLSLDLIMAKVFLSPDDAGRYAILSLTGKMIYMIGSLFSGFIIPIVSRNEGEGSPSEKSFYKILGATTGTSFLAFLVFGVFGFITTPILFGSKVESIITFLPLYTFAIFMQTVASTIVSYHQAKNKHIFSYLGLIISFVQIYLMMLIHSDIKDLVLTVVIGGSLYLSTIVFLHIYYDQVNTIIRNLIDLLGIFTVKEPNPEINPSGKQRILIFNWRDIKHVWSGGAELYIHEISKRLVKSGYNVTVFCGNDNKNPSYEVIDDVHIIRHGGFYTVYIWAFLYYIFRFRNNYDVIIDSENGIPFFTPLYSDKKIFLLIHHIHQDLFRIKLRPPLSWIGKYLEKQIMPKVYRNTEIITVSPSSKADIQQFSISQKEAHIIYNGVDTNVFKPAIKSKKPMILYLGRLTAQKSLSVLVRAAKKIIKKIPNVEIIIAGDGDDKKHLMKLVKTLNLETKIKFTGKVTEAEKLSLYQKAWVFVNPSLMEGWGITTIEANACGTPVVASNVSGLRDSVHNPHSGLLIPYGNTDEFSKNIIYLLKNRKIRNKMNKESIDWANKFNWDKSAKDLENLFNLI